MVELMRGERLQIMLTQDELRALDDWRFKRRMPSRAAAIRELLKRGLASEGFALADGDTKSQDFGVIKDQSDAEETGDRTDN
jgi:metal-responsive CopG/Arc/MetJ family transcriptional regulator